MESGRKPSPFESQLRELIVKEEINQPLLFKGIHKDWEPCTWSLEEWGNLFKDEKLTVRYGSKGWSGLQPQWESQCGKADLTWKEFMDWNKGEFQFLPKNASPEEVWVYYDYRYLPDVFNFGKDGKQRDFLKVITFNENLKKKFCWSTLGFSDRNSDHSTLWIGSSGSYTPCHFDTYSCNLVCQVYGRKRWLLFPPEDTDRLQPTRIPYEESSVYSGINFNSAKRLSSLASDLEKCTPYQVTLEAGDCLFLPQRWWHFVQSQDFSISVNTWIELPGDHSTRVEEALLRTVTSTVVNMTFPEAAKEILNPNEIDVADMSAMDLNELLRSATSSYIESQQSKILQPFKLPTSNPSCNVSVNLEEQSTSQSTEISPSPLPPRKKSKQSSLSLQEFLSLYQSRVEVLSPSSYQVLFPSENNQTNPSPSNKQSVPMIPTRSPSYLEHLVNAIGHPSVLKRISEQFLQNVAQNPPT